jgi:hypothetical protein
MCSWTAIANDPAKENVMAHATFSYKAQFAILLAITFTVLGTTKPAHGTSGGAIMGPSTSYPGWVQLPGALVRPDCVHEVPKGATVGLHGDVSLNGSVIAHYDACPSSAVVNNGRDNGVSSPPPPSVQYGWVEDWEETTPAPATYLFSQWVVPTDPKLNGGVIYLFNAIVPSTFNAIMQPVLVYGYHGAYWEITSVLGDTNNNYWYSPFERVNDGDTIQGTVTLTSGDPNDTEGWQIYIYDASTTAYTYQNITSYGLNWTQVYAGALEAYYTTECTMFPNSSGIAFSNVYVQVINQSGQYPNSFWAPNHPNIPDYDNDSDDYNGVACGFGPAYFGPNYLLLWSSQQP